MTSKIIPDIPDELCKAAVLFIIIYINRRERVCTNTSTRSIMTKANFGAILGVPICAYIVKQIIARQ